MTTCPNCKDSRPDTERNCSLCGTLLSAADDSLDSLVQAASIPNLADLFRKAKQTGAIGSVSVYGEGS